MKNYKKFLKQFIYCRENLKLMIFINIIIIVISCSSLLLPYFSKIIINAITSFQKIDEVSTYFLTFIAIIISTLLFNIIQNIVSIRFIEKTIVKCRLMIFDQILKERKPIEIGQEIYNLFTSIPVICNSGIFMPINFFVSVLVFLGANILLLMQSYISVLIVNICLLMNIIIYSLYFKKAKKAIDSSQTITAEKYENIKNQLDNYNLIFDFNTQHFESKIFKNQIDEIMKVNTDKGITISKFTSIFSFISSLLTVAILYIGYLLVLSKHYTLGDILILNSFLTILIPYTNKMIDQLNQYPIIVVNLQKISNYLYNSAIPHKYGKEVVTGINKIEFINMNFSYGKNEIFKKFNMKIDKSEHLVLIKGKSGIGKSTLLNLIYLNQQCQNYYINNRDCHDYSFDSLREHISYYHNSHGLINGSIFDNLKYGNNIEDNELVYTICKITEIHEHIMKLPNNYYTQVKFNDSILSTGEIQRICLARTLLKNADFYLLDEPFSNLDDKTINKILIKMKYYHKNYIIVAHSIKNETMFSKIIDLQKED